MTSLGEIAQVSPDLKQQYAQAGLWENVPLWHLLWCHLPKFENRIAVRDDKETLTYSALVTQADQVAAGLLSQGWTSGDHIVMQLSNSCQFAVTLFGLLRAGIIPVMALPAHGLVEIEHFMRISSAKGYIGEGLSGQQMIDALQKQPDLKLYLVDQITQPYTLPCVAMQTFNPAIVNPETPALFFSVRRNNWAA